MKFDFDSQRGAMILAGGAIVFALGVLYAPVYGPEAALFCELFDTRVRYSGISVVYQVSGIVSSSITPLIRLRCCTPTTTSRGTSQSMCS